MPTKKKVSLPETKVIFSIICGGIYNWEKYVGMFPYGTSVMSSKNDTALQEVDSSEYVATFNANMFVRISDVDFVDMIIATLTLLSDNIESDQSIQVIGHDWAFYGIDCDDPLVPTYVQNKINRIYDILEDVDWEQVVQRKVRVVE